MNNTVVETEQRLELFQGILVGRMLTLAAAA